MAPRCLQHGPRCIKDGLRWLPDGLRRPKRPPRGFQDGPGGLQKRPKLLSSLWFLKDFGMWLFSAFRRLKTAEEVPNIAAHEASKMAP
eukprot:2341361-Pyramimonas_sp.AAC.1